MTAEKGRANSGRAPESSPKKSAGKKRVCRFLFVLGAGVEPGDVASDLVAEFQRAGEGLDFQRAETVTGTADEWPVGDKAAFKTAVLRFVAQHCKTSSVAFDERRLLMRDYAGTDGRQYAVVGYFPASRAAAEGSAGDPSEDSAGDDDAESESVPGAVEKLLAAVKRVPPKQLAIGGGVLAALILAVFVVPALISAGGDDSEFAESEETSDDQSGNPGAGAGETAFLLPAPVFPTGKLRVYTNEPGFELLIDGEIVRDVEGNPVRTPCELVAARGTRTITAYAEGYFDLSRTVDIEADSEIELSPSENSLGTISDAASAPYRNAEVGTPIPLATINTRRPEFDPFVTPDGLSLWFVGDRDEGRGIYNASRMSTRHDFENIRLIARSSDLPGTPSLTDDALDIVYAVPEKARLMTLTRESPLAEFTGKDPLRFSKSLQPNWLSVQILGDGRRLYWVEQNSEDLRTLTVSRDQRDGTFGKTFKTTLPGLHPCLSQDGLRQYSFQNGVLTRYRRSAVTKKFLEDAVIAQLELPGYKPSELHRQFVVSSDEQWLFYCDDPVSGGDLFMVRIFDGPQWGVRPRGNSIPPKMAVVVETDPGKPDPSEEMIIPEKPEPKPVDPRSLPLPYTSHWGTFNTLLAGRQYDEVDELLKNARTNPELQAFHEQLDWDAADFAAIRDFWKRVETYLGGLSKGSMLRLGTLRIEFSEFVDGEIVGARSGAEVRKKLVELSPTELSSLFDSAAEKDDIAAQYSFGVLLAHDKDAIDRAIAQRFERAPALAARFRERIARRSLVQAQAELDRSNFGEGIQFLKETMALSIGTSVSSEAQQLEDRLYDFVKWTPRGPRQWVIDGNSYQAPLSRSNGSLLVSEKQYGSFDLSLEYLTEADTTSQGGVYFRYSGNGNLNEGAFKIQLANDRGIRADPYCTGALFGEQAPTENAARPAGEWNTLLIRNDGIKVTVTLNGVKVLDEVPAANPAIPRRGYIGLDGAAGGITYRKMLLSDRPEQ